VLLFGLREITVYMLGFRFLSELNQRIKQVFRHCDINFLEKTLELALIWEQIREMSEDALVDIESHYKSSCLKQTYEFCRTQGNRRFTG